MTNNTVVCERDLTNPQSNNAASNAATNSLAILIELYSNLGTEISNAFASDYVPFENNGEIITGLYESNVSPVNHTANDNLANMDVTYAYEVIKGSLGAALEFAVAFETLSVEEENSFNEMISISPNPSNNYLNISFKNPLQQAVDFKLIDTLGKQVLQDTLTKQNQTITLDSIASAQYFAVFKIDNKRFVKTIIVE